MVDTRHMKRTAALLRSGAACEKAAADELDAAVIEIESLRLRLMNAEQGAADAARAERLYRETEALLTGRST